VWFLHAIYITSLGRIFRRAYTRSSRIRAGHGELLGCSEWVEETTAKRVLHALSWLCLGALDVSILACWAGGGATTQGDDIPTTYERHEPNLTVASLACKQQLLLQVCSLACLPLLCSRLCASSTARMHQAELAIFIQPSDQLRLLPASADSSKATGQTPQSHHTAAVLQLATTLP
jgi:hypothetical protein